MSAAANQEGIGVLPTLNEDGSRRWIRPRPSRGRLWKRRRAVAYALIALFTILPYVRIAGKPAILLDLAQRRFTIFGFTFLPTDTLLLALFMIGVFVAVFLLTALFGRVWCGWACPQTVYLEFVYRPIERLLEGEPGGRGGRVKDPGLRKVIKFGLYLAVSTFLAHTFLAYFVGVEQLAVWVRRSPLEHPASFLVMASVTALMMFDFGSFREQLCIVACPYGRLQSVMLDRASLIVGYDRRRGEPRGRKKAKPARGPSCRCPDCDGSGGCDRERGASPSDRLSLPVMRAAASPIGDCIDCRMCVTTCPTGIDIRNGLQMECINCAQCIDACDAVMTKIGRPTGLIRYASQATLEGEPARRFRPRVVLYPSLLAVVAVLFTRVLLGQGEADVAVVRGVGMPFNVLPDGRVGNQARVRITNRTDRPQRYALEAVGAAGVLLQADENPIPVGPGEMRWEKILLIAPRSAFHAGQADVRLRVSAGAYAEELPYRMLGPADVAPTPRATSDEVAKGEPDA